MIVNKELRKTGSFAESKLEHAALNEQIIGAAIKRVILE